VYKLGQEKRPSEKTEVLAYRLRYFAPFYFIRFTPKHVLSIVEGNAPALRGKEIPQQNRSVNPAGLPVLNNSYTKFTGLK